jgi:hypothetical protein
MRRQIGCGLALALAGWSVAAPGSKAPADPDYYPTAVGTKWVYDLSGRDLTWEVTAAETKAGETWSRSPRRSRAGSPSRL